LPSLDEAISAFEGNGPVTGDDYVYFFGATSIAMIGRQGEEQDSCCRRLFLILKTRLRSYFGADSSEGSPDLKSLSWPDPNSRLLHHR
jgi:hypothetical protein